MNRVHPFPPALLALLLASPAAATQEPSDSASEAAFVEWAGENAVPIQLEGSLDPAILRPHVVDKRFVFLGEPDHFIHEKYPFRLTFLRALHELGWRHLGMEMGRSDGLRFDAYLEGGDERDLSSVALYSGSDIDAQIRQGGFQAMEYVYARAVRELGEGDERMRYFGFDIDTVPRNGLTDAQARLQGQEAAEDFLAMLADIRASGSRLEDLAALLEELEDPESPFLADLPPYLAAEAFLDVHVFHESLTFMSNPLFSESEPVNLVEGFARRERTMFRLFDHYVERIGAGGRIALTGHNMHLGRSWKGARWRELNTEQDIPLWHTIGAHVTEKHPDDVFAIWLVYDHGTHLMNTNLAQERKLESVPGSVENLLARLPHDTLFLPLKSDDPRSQWLDRERSFRVNGGVARGHLRRLADALVFVRSVRPPGSEL